MLHPGSSSTWYPPHFLQQSLMAALIRWPLWASRTRPPGLSWRLSPGYLGLEKLTMCDWTAMKAERLSPLSSAWRYLWSFMHVSASRHTQAFSTKIFTVFTVSIRCYWSIHLDSRSKTWSWFSAIPSSAWRFHPMPIPSAKPPKHLGKCVLLAVHASLCSNIVEWVGAGQLLLPRIGGSLLTLLV